MRSSEERARVAALVAEGVNDCAIARQTGIPRSTIREWRARLEPRARTIQEGRRIQDLAAWDYSYLLGIYLGDDYLFKGRRAGIQLHPTSNMVIVSLYSSQWESLLPQHGPGMKHTRRIELGDSCAGSSTQTAHGP